VNGANFIEKRAEAIHLLPGVLVVRFLDVGDQISEWSRLPIGLAGSRFPGMALHFERVHHLVQRHTRRATSLFEGLLAPAAIIDP